jgi:hypothetical protein
MNSYFLYISFRPSYDQVDVGYKATHTFGRYYKVP